MLALFLEPKWKRYHPAVSKTARHMVVAGCGVSLADNHPTPLALSGQWCYDGIVWLVA
jgi:hypothetical protein